MLGMTKYLGPFGAYLMPYLPKKALKDVSVYQNDRCSVVVNLHYLQSGKKNIICGKKTQRLYG